MKRVIKPKVVKKKEVVVVREPLLNNEVEIAVEPETLTVANITVEETEPV